MRYTIDNLTFGFELEGEFENSLVKEVDDFIDCSSSIFHELDENRWTYDGSVDRIKDLDNEFEEFRSPWVEGKKGLKELLKLLRLFSHENGYYPNSSAGFHFHVGVQKMNNYDLLAIFGSWEMVSSMQKRAKKWSPLLADRLKNNGYTKPYVSAKAFMIEARSHSKYRFVRFHPSDTLEFRFLPTTNTTKDKTKMIRWIVKEVLHQLNLPAKKLPREKVVIDEELLEPATRSLYFVA